MKHTVIPSVNVFVVRDDKILLGRRADTGWMDGYLCPPGGHVEPYETPRLAMLREIREELGVDIDPADLEFVCVAVRNTTPTEYVGYEFAINDKGYEFYNAEPDKCSELVWADVKELPDDIVAHFNEIITEGLLGGTPYLEIGY
ncbi:MAG: hypothetical protein JWM37_239 [Candidatus Saccharibacteria bacterium]|nr:hypothetical protein [Candidatus Saccharibacteria bacterium]